MNHSLKISLAAIPVVLATGAIALPAAARGVAAYPGGRAAFPADASCFAEQWGAAVNTCNTMKSYTIALHVDSAGPKDVWVFAYGPNSTDNVRCRAIGESADLQSTWATGFTPLPSYGSPQSIYLHGQGVYDWGTLYAYCNVEPGARIHNVLYQY